MDWGRVDDRLIRRGMLLLDLGFVNGYDDELKRMNEISLASSLQIATLGLSALLGTCSPWASDSLRASRSLCIGWFLGYRPSTWIRRRVLKLNLSPYEALRDWEGGHSC